MQKPILSMAWHSQVAIHLIMAENLTDFVIRISVCLKVIRTDSFTDITLKTTKNTVIFVPYMLSAYRENIVRNSRMHKT